MIAITSRLSSNPSSPKPHRSFLRSRPHPKPRRNLRSRYASMVESIHPRPDRSGSSDCGSFTTRRTRSSSSASYTSLTNPTIPYQDSDHGRLGSKFSVLKPEATRNQTPQVPQPKIMTLPSWLRDTITELDVSNPLRTVFPTLHDVSDPALVNRSFENPPNYQSPRHDVNRPYCSHSTPPIPSGARLPDSDTSSDEPQASSALYPLYNNDSLLHVRSGSPAHPIGALLYSEVAFPTTPNYHPNSSAFTSVAKTPHICAGFETTSLPASSPSHNLRDPVSPSAAARRDIGCDDIFRYDPSQADFTTPVLSPSEPFVFESPAPVYFHSPIEDPIGSDPLEPSDYCDPFKLDLEEYKKLDFKWAPFGPPTGITRETRSGEPETNGKPSVIG